MPTNAAALSRVVLILLFALAAACPWPAFDRNAHCREEELPVFPGAIGFGTHTPAGRGGRIIHVTTLSPSGPGSLREALKAQGPRIIVFDVGGVIRLRRNITVREPFVTVAGQTAPPPGVTVSGAALAFRTHDVLVRHLSVRAGDAPEGPKPADRDCIKVQGGKYAPAGAYNIVIDHCSAGWAVDEAVSLWYEGVRDVTVSRCIISENLNNSLHPKGSHSKGLLVGDHAERVSVIGNLFAHNRSRNPMLKGGSSSVVANNFIYNFGWKAVRLDGDRDNTPIIATIVGNVAVMGPDSPDDDPVVTVAGDVDTATLKLFEAANPLFATTDQALADNAPANVSTAEIKADAPLWTPGLKLHSPSSTVRSALAFAGARPAERGPVDARIAAEVRAGGGMIIDSPRQVGGLHEFGQSVRRAEPPDDPNGDDDGDGYANVEEWLHGLSAKLIGEEQHGPSE